MAPLVGSVLDAGVVDAVATAWRRYLDGRAPLLDARVAAGHAVDGHGDLQCEDVFCLADGPRILDCLAFDDQLRHGDVLLDAAFLAMDLERLAGPTLANAFLAAYQEFSGESHPASLAHHYVAYRAQVRAKVACLRAGQGDRAAAAEAAAHLRRCQAHLARGQIRLVLVGGSPGTGKTTLAQAVGDGTEWVVLSSDEVRKQQAGMAPTDDATAAVDAGLYRPESVTATYGELLRRAGALLEQGESVVLDGSWTDATHRRTAAELARRTAADLVQLHVDAAPDVVSARIAARRSAGSDASDATVAVADALRARFEPWPDAVEIDTGGPLGEAVDAALAAIG